MHNIPDQVKRLPEDASHIVLSIGGNNGLDVLDRLQRKGILNPLNIFSAMNEIRTTLREEYATTLDLILAQKKGKLIACTIYYPCFSSFVGQKVCNLGVYVFNWCIHLECQVTLRLLINNS
jgi:hypothetical protein